MYPYLHHNINKKNNLQPTKNYRASLLSRGSSLKNMAAEGQSGGHRGFHSNSLGWPRRRESNGVEGTQEGLPTSPASLTDQEGDTGVASEGQNSCRNHASKFPEFRGPVRQAPRRGCGQSGGGEGKRNSSA